MSDIHIVTEQEFMKEHATHFYTKYPTREAFIKAQQDRVDYKIHNSPKRVDTEFFRTNADKFIQTLTDHLYDNKGYLYFLRAYYNKKLKVDTNELSKAMKKMGKGISIIEPTKDHPRKQFKSHGTDQGRAIITNLSYKEISTCKKGKPVDILTWEALNDVTDMKHVMRPAYWNNIINGDFDLPTLEESRDKHFDTLIKLISMFADRASVFRTGVYAAIINHYTPFAETSLHLVGSWNTPTLAASALTRLKHQVIIDVIPRQKEVGEFIYENFIPASLTKPKHKYDFIICPSEQLQNRLDFENKFKDYFDVQLFSPVYFNTEEYNTVDEDAGEQSIESFPTYEKWIEGYFHQTIRTAYEVMKPGSKFIIVISDFEYQDKQNKKWYYISKDMLDITSLYFKQEETADLILTSGTGFTNKALTEKRREGRKTLFSEHVHVFTKDEQYHKDQEQNRANFDVSTRGTLVSSKPKEAEPEQDSENTELEANLED